MFFIGQAAKLKINNLETPVIILGLHTKATQHTKAKLNVVHLKQDGGHTNTWYMSDELFFLRVQTTLEESPTEKKIFYGPYCNFVLPKKEGVKLKLQDSEEKITAFLKGCEALMQN